MKKLILVVAIIVSSTATYAQNAYISIDSVYAAIPNYLEKVQRLNETATKYREDITASRKYNQEQLNQLVGPYNPQSDEAFDKLKVRMKDTDALKLDLILDEDNVITKKEASYNKIVQLDYDKSILPDQELVNKIIADYAKSKKLEAIYSLEQLKPALQYVNPTKIITQDIIAALKKQLKN